MSERLFHDLKARSEATPILSSKISDEIGRSIVSGRYAPGELVEDEGRLATHFEVSRTVIRDAIKVLVGKGLLELRRGIGTRVRPRSEWGLLDDDVLAWQLSSPIDKALVQQLMEVRLIIEPRAARWAAERANDADLQAIKAACESMRSSLDSSDDFVLADAEFHRSVLHAAHNEFLSALEGVIFTALLGSIRLTNFDPGRNEHSVPYHEGVYQAIKAQNGDLADELMQQLLADARYRLDNLAPES